MRMRLAIIGLAALALAATGCSKIKAINAPKPEAGNANYSVYVAMGTSISAGWQSGGLVDRHQVHAFPALFAKQVGMASFQMPTVGGDGLPALMRLVSISPLVVTNAGRVNGSATNRGLSTAYHDMAVPYSVLPDVVDSSLYYVSAPTLPPYRPVMFDHIVRHRGTILSEVLGLDPKPTFISFEYGSNEVLGPATSGRGTVSVSPTAFAAVLRTALDALQANLPGVKLALFNVPDVTTIPFLTTLPPVVLGANGQPVQPITPLLGTGASGPNNVLIPGTDLLTLTAGPLMAAGYGYPVGATSYLSGTPVPGNGIPLPDSVVLSGSEITTLRAITGAYNAAIGAEATARGFATVDLAGLLRQARTTGFTVGGVTYTSAFLTGGLFSLDGVHPDDLAHGLLCNALIDAVNGTYGSRIPHVSLAAAASARADGARLALGEGPFVPVRFEGELGLGDWFPWR